METKIEKVLKDKGFTINQKALNVIKDCDDWYRGKTTDWHKRTNVNGLSITIDTLNFAKRLCADDANLCEIVEVNAGEQSFDEINAILKGNRFDVMYRKQLEQMSASGTVGCYPYIDEALYNDDVIVGGKVRLNYVNAEGIYPLTIVNDEITEVAFAGSNIVKGKKQEVCVIFTKENGLYNAETITLDDDGNIVSDTEVQLGDVKPFAIMRTSEVNNINDMKGYGYPKIYTSIPVLRMLDLCFFILYGDLDKGEKLVFINELLACINEVNGKPELTNQQKELFILLGEKLPNESDVIYEYNPELRIEAITKILETLLSILSLSFGFGTKKYTFENGQIKTASEYIGERQDCMQELNKQRKEATDYITGIISAIAWFSNTFCKTAFSVDEVNVDFDDSYVIDKATELERLRTDALSFDIPELLIWYLMGAYNLDEKEATALVMKTKEAEEEEEVKEVDTDD